MKTPLALVCAAFLVSSCTMLGASTDEIVYVAEASGGA
jgi:predicted small secreted protein